MNRMCKSRNRPVDYDLIIPSILFVLSKSLLLAWETQREEFLDRISKMNRMCESRNRPPLSG